LTASATIVIDQKSDVIVVPLRAVHRQGRDQVVDIVGEDGKTSTPQAVKTGVQNDQFVEITDGLQEGQQIMVQGTTTRAPNVPGGALPGPGGGARVFVGGPGR
jgi:multidrug efflux pump subunit AcrA (membrane-fusion protein)